MIKRVLGSTLATVLLIGCGGREPVFDNPNSGLVLSRDRALIVRDESQVVDVNLRLARGEQFGTAATLSVSGLPQGVTAAFDHPTVTLSDNNIHTVHLTFTSDRTLPIGQSEVLVHRTANGREETARLSLATSDFAVYVEADDSSVTLAPGEHHDTDVVLTRRGSSSGTVELDLAGDVPDGVSWTISPGRVLIDPDHPRVHVNLRLEAADDASQDANDRCRVRALKGTNHNESDEIAVMLDVPDEG